MGDGLPDKTTIWPELILWPKVACFYNIVSVILRGLFYIFILKDVVKVPIGNLLFVLRNLLQFPILLVK